MKRKKYYYQQYDIKEFTDARGKVRKEAVYKGIYYALDCPEGTFGRAKWRNVLRALLISVVFFAVSFLLDTPGMRQFYVILPFICVFLPLIFFWGDAYSMAEQKENRFTEKQRDALFGRAAVCSLWMGILAAVAAIGDIGYVCFAKDGKLVEEYLFILGSLLMAGLGFLFYYYKNSSKEAEIPAAQDNPGNDVSRDKNITDAEN